MSTFNEGTKPQGILTRALTENVFVEKNLAYMNEGDKDGYNVYKHDVKNVLQARTANPAASANENTEKNAIFRSLTHLESMETFDPADYHNYWREYQPTGLFQWEELPAVVKFSLEELFLGHTAMASEELLTNGGATDPLLGLVYQLQDDDLTDLAGVEPTSAQITQNTHICFRAHAGGSGDREGVALTAQNIFAKMEILIKNQNRSMRKRPNRKFMMGSAAIDLMREAQRTELNFKGVDITEAGIMRYGGFEVIENKSFPTNDIVFASMGGDFINDAFQMGTSSSADFNNVTVDRLSNFGREYGMLLTFTLDIFVVRPEEVCYYTDQALITD
jgi:hypothetical protein